MRRLYAILQMNPSFMYFLLYIRKFRPIWSSLVFLKMFIDQNQFLSTFFYNRRILITSVFHFVATVEEREEDMTQSSGVLSIMTKPTETSWTNQEKM